MKMDDKIKLLSTVWFVILNIYSSYIRKRELYINYSSVLTKATPVFNLGRV